VFAVVIVLVMVLVVVLVVAELVAAVFVLTLVVAAEIEVIDLLIVFETAIVKDVVDLIWWNQILVPTVFS